MTINVATSLFALAIAYADECGIPRTVYGTVQNNERIYC